jgi:hypothetical protein
LDPRNLNFLYFSLLFGNIRNFWRVNKDAEGRVHGHILADSTADAADLRNRKSDEVT